jgi:hypothetical protein
METIPLPVPSSDYYIAFEGDARYGYGVCIDDISVSPGCTPPATQATNFSISNAQTSSMTIGWTRGSGTNVLVVARAGSPVNADPIEGTTYYASTTFSYGQQIGSGNYVVYNGNGTSVNITGLSYSTNYYFAIYEYDNISNCYLTPPLRGNRSLECSSYLFPVVVNFEEEHCQLVGRKKLDLPFGSLLKAMVLITLQAQT